MSTIALVGNPNCGKTTLFNALTGSRQHVGNWPGVTVERKHGFFIHNHIRFEVVDLPGVYSLTVASESAAIDESLACQFILQQEAEVIVNILDGSNLERHLYLTTQLLEIGVPLIVVVNMIDIAKTRGIQLKLDLLSATLGCPVLPLQANKGKGLEALKSELLRALVSEKEKAFPPQVLIPYASPIPEVIQKLARLIRTSLPEGTTFPFSLEWLASRLLEDDLYAKKQISPELLPQVASFQEEIRKVQGEDPDILLADGRYRYISELITSCLSQSPQATTTWTARLDKLILNRIFGLPFFLGIMYSLFFFAINVGAIFQDYFDLASNTIFVDGLHQLLSYLGLPKGLVVLLVSGIGTGLTTTMTFIPVIGALFLFLSFLEDSGYMARAAFVVDRLMRVFGLPGKAFVPMIVGFGCNVPAVMAARTLENKRDRILTIMMSPFMSCGARLAIYAVFTAAFFPKTGSWIVFLLYLVGILMAVLTGLILRKTLLQGQPAPLVMELPAYHLPQLRTVLTHAWQRLQTFIFRAGKLIVPISLFIAILLRLNLDGSLNQGGDSSHSVLAACGRFLTPLFAPMGIHQDNWPATVGLITGVLAKEVVIGSLNALYSSLAHLSALATAPNQSLTQAASLLLYQHFDGKLGAFSYLLFVLLYFPCVSTTAVMWRELNYRWALFSTLWMTLVAYGVAVCFYQVATWTEHSLSSLLWVVGLLSVFMTVVIMMRRMLVSQEQAPVLA